MRCKDNSFKHNTICFAGQNAFSLTFSTEKVIIRGFLQHLATKKAVESVLKTIFSLPLRRDFLKSLSNNALKDMKRFAFKMFLKPGFEEEYERRHAALWPELKKQIKEAGVRNYSIYWDRDTNILFGYQEIEGEQSSQDMGADETTQKWWAYMKDIMVTNPDNSPVTIPIQEVFHLD